MNQTNGGIEVQAFEKKKEDQLLSRNIRIFRSVAEGATITQAAKEAGCSTSVVDKVLLEMLKMVFEVAKEKGEDPALTYTQEKYPHLYAKVQGESQLASYLFKRKDLAAEKEFLVSKLSADMRRPEKKRMFGDTFLPAEHAQMQKTPLHVFKTPRCHRGVGR